MPTIQSETTYRYYVDTSACLDSTLSTNTIPVRKVTMLCTLKKHAETRSLRVRSHCMVGTCHTAKCNPTAVCTFCATSGTREYVPLGRPTHGGRVFFGYNNHPKCAERENPRVAGNDGRTRFSQPTLQANFVEKTKKRKYP